MMMVALVSNYNLSLGAMWLAGGDDTVADDDYIYIMMKCLSVCNEKSSLSPVSLL